MIPAASDAQPFAHQAATGTANLAPPELATASIIIAVAEDPQIAAAPHADDGIPLRLAESFGTPASDVAPPEAAPAAEQPAIVETSAAVEPTVSPHITRRQRRKRRQLNTAILLLAAVILLALVLIWVLQRGENSSAAKELTTQVQLL